MADYQTRLRWCQEIFTAPWMKVSNLEENSSQSVFAKEIFYQLSLQKPDAAYFWILGEDQLNQLPYWNSIDDYASSLGWIALAREIDHHKMGLSLRSRRLTSNTCSYSWAVIDKRFSISSTEIRKNVFKRKGDIPPGIREEVVDFYKNQATKE